METCIKNSVNLSVDAKSHFVRSIAFDRVDDIIEIATPVLMRNDLRTDCVRFIDDDALRNARVLQA